MSCAGLKVLSLFLLVAVSHAFTFGRTQLQRTLSALSSLSADADVENASVDLDTATEMAKLFNRMSDKFMLLDVEGAGSPGMINCCHSGCDNCEFRFRFDQMSAGRAKWVPLYPDRKHIDGRSHLAPWSVIFFDSVNDFEKAKEEVAADAPFLSTSRGDAMSITMDRFVNKIQEMTPVLSMGPPSGIGEEPPSTEFLRQFWRKLVSTAGVPADTESLSPGQMSKALEALTKAEHGANWRQFSASFDQ